MGSSSSNEKEITAEELKKIEDQIEKDNKTRKEILMDVGASLKHDDSLVNLVHNYAKIRVASPSKLECVGACVKEMKNGWSIIMKQLKTIEKYGEKGKEKSKTMTSIYYEYWKLLLKTKNKLYLLSKETKFQKDNINMLFEIIGEAHNNKSELLEDDKKAYKECINTLGQWIKTNDIYPLITEWHSMAQKLEEQKSDWVVLANEAGAYYRGKTHETFGNLVISSTIVAGIIIGIGAFTVAMGGISPAFVVAKFLASQVISLSTTTVLASAISVGSFGATLYGISQIYKFREQSGKIQNDINKIIKKLEDMLRASNNMTSKLNDVEASKKEIDDTLERVKDYQSFRKMKSSLDQLLESLDEFDKKNVKAIKQIDEAVTEFLGP